MKLTNKRHAITTHPIKILRDCTLALPVETIIRGRSFINKYGKDGRRRKVAEMMRGGVVASRLWKYLEVCVCVCVCVCARVCV